MENVGGLNRVCSVFSARSDMGSLHRLLSTSQVGRQEHHDRIRLPELRSTMDDVATQVSGDADMQKSSIQPTSLHSDGKHRPGSPSLTCSPVNAPIRPRSAASDWHHGLQSPCSLRCRKGTDARSEVHGSTGHAPGGLSNHRSRAGHHMLNISYGHIASTLEPHGAGTLGSMAMLREWIRSARAILCQAYSRWRPEPFVMRERSRLADITAVTLLLLWSASFAGSGRTTDSGSAV
jgi:hypothetical protein